MSDESRVIAIQMCLDTAANLVVRFHRHDYWANAFLYHLSAARECVTYVVGNEEMKDDADRGR